MCDYKKLMTQETENILSEFDESPVYGSFQDRLFASLIDGLILLPLAAIDWFNKSDWKSQVLLIVVFAIGVLYKVFFEFKFGATIGKKSMKLIVVNKEFKDVNMKEVLVRNIFDIIWRTFFFIISLIIYRSPEFGNITSNEEFMKSSNNLININPYLLIYTLITITEIIFILTDKKKRALHDRLGDTFVIENNRT